MVRIAVCSRNGIAVDVPFATAACFYIYDVGRSTFGLAGMRLSHYCRHDLPIYPDEEELQRLFALLCDCEFLFTEMIDPETLRWLENKRISVVVGRRSVTELSTLVKTLKKKELTHA